MSTDLHDRTRQPAPDERPAQPEKPKSALSIAQVVGGALAAMTAAALGSRLSVAGTVIGAALASVVAALAGAVYTASLRRTSQHVNAVLTRVRPSAVGAAPASRPASQVTTDTPATPADDVAATAWDLPARTADPVTDVTTSEPAPPRIGWKKVVVGALLMFVIAALVLTGIELVTGRALSGGAGTTVGQVAEPSTRPASAPTRTASASPRGSASAEPSATASAEPSSSASSTPSSAPTSEPSTTAGATPTTAPTTSAAPSTTPSALAAPSGVTTPS